MSKECINCQSYYDCLSAECLPEDFKGDCIKNNREHFQQKEAKKK